MNRRRITSLLLPLSMVAALSARVELRAGEESAADWAARARKVAARRLSDRRPAPGTSAPRPTDLLNATPQPSGFTEVPGFELSGSTGSDPPQAAGPAPPAEARSASTGPAAETRPAVPPGPLPDFGRTVLRDLKEAPDLLWHDTCKVFGDPGNLIFLIGAGGVSAALRPEVDDDIEDHYDRHRTFSDDWPDTFGALGNPAVHWGFVLGWYTLGQVTQDIKTYEVGKRAISALALTGISTMLLKVAANTESPNGENLAWPSGHVSSTMALATVLNHAYGPLVGLPMFGLTGLVAVERMDDREHHFSDVVFGAALGWVVAETIMKEHRPEIFGGQIAPYADLISGSSGIAWIKTFDPPVTHKEQKVEP